MGAVAWTLLTGLIAGLSAAAPWMVYASRVVPSLERQSARRAAYSVAMLPAAIASLLQLAHVFGFTTGSVRDDVILIAATVGVACSWGPIAMGAIAVTGGPTVLRDSAPTQVTRPPPAPNAQGPRSVGYVLGVGLFILTMTTFTVPAIASLRTCLDTERILGDAEPGPINPNPIDIAFSYNPPEYGAEFQLDFPMSLDLAAESRSDPAALEQLTAAGFVGAHVRSWMAQDSNWIEAEVMEFETPEGAATYQGQVNRYACGYANEAFEAPMGGIGLQVRYGSGAPYVEQISWVAGNRRYKVQISAYQRPSEHGRILQIQEAVTATWPTEPPAASEPSPSPTPQSSVGPTSIDEVRAAAEATIAQGTVFINKHVRFEGQAEIPPDATAFNGLVSLTGAGDLRGVVEPLATASFDGNALEVILDDAKTYLRGAAIDPLVGAGQWLVFDAASEDPLADTYTPIVRGYNEAAMALYSLYGITSVTGVSDDVVHELPAHRYVVEIDLQAALDAIPRKQRERFRAHLDALRAAGIGTGVKAEIWVAPDGLVHHIDLVQALGAEIGGGSMRTSVDLFDFGVPLDLDLPEPELVTAAEDVKDRNRGLGP